MKVLQTIGSRGGQAGIFQYKRTIDGVHIDMSVGQTAAAATIDIPASDWQSLLKDLQTGNATYTLTELNNHIMNKLRPSIPDINASDAACVSAILEHEGSIDHYGGTAGPNTTVNIHLRRDY